MPCPTVHDPLPNLVRFDAVIPPGDLRLGREILSADPSQVWQAREVETAPTAEPQMWRDWNLESRGLDAERVSVSKVGGKSGTTEVDDGLPQISLPSVHGGRS
jgi:hypothetical protein